MHLHALHEELWGPAAADKIMLRWRRTICCKTRTAGDVDAILMQGYFVIFEGI